MASTAHGAQVHAPSLVRSAARGKQARAILRGLQSTGLGVLGLALLLVVWILVAAATSAVKVPPPNQVFNAITNDWGDIPAVAYITFTPGGIRDALEFSALNVFVAVGVGTLIGVPFGIFLGRVRTANLVLEPLLLALGTMPLLIVLPFITLWFGTARFAQSGLVLIFTILTVTFASQAAAQTVSDHYEQFAACMGASRMRRLWTVVLPAAMPGVLAAVRVALAAGWGWECVAELLGSARGVGRVIQITAQTEAVADLFAVLLCLAVVAVLADSVVAVAGGICTRWRE
jgi:ABC-type nitrate/sulfonate/bicarbonate transport system permease component